MKWIIYLDFLGTKPTFNIKGQASYKSLFGGALSIIVFVSIMTGAVYFINQLLSKTNFTIIQSEEYYPQGYMDWTNYEMAVTIVDKLGEKIPDTDRIYTIKGMWYLYDVKKNSNKSEIEMETTTRFFNMEFCDLNKHFTNSTDLWKAEKFLSTSYCFPKDYPLNTSQIYSSAGNKGITLFLTRCFNTTTKNNCYSTERIEKELQNVIVMTRIKNFYFDHKVNGDTGVPYIFTHSPSISYTVLYKFNYFMQNVEYLTDDSLFLTSSKETQYNIIGDQRQSSDLNKDSVVPGTFSTIFLNMYPMKKNFKKNYYKFQNMLADLGGLLKGIHTIAAFINLYFSNKLYYDSIICENTHSLLENSSYQNQKNNDDIKINEKSIQNIRSTGFNLNEGNSKIDNIPNLTNNYVNFDISNQNIKANEQYRRSKINKISTNGIKLEPVSLIIKKSYSTGILKEILKIGYYELIFPSWCLPNNSKAKKNIKLHKKVSDLIKLKFDISNMFSKFCNIDKLEYIICGEDMMSFRKLFNPTFYKDQCIPNDSDIFLFREKILENLSKTKNIS